MGAPAATPHSRARAAAAPAAAPRHAVHQAHQQRQPPSAAVLIDLTLWEDDEEENWPRPAKRRRAERRQRERQEWNAEPDRPAQPLQPRPQDVQQQQRGEQHREAQLREVWRPEREAQQREDQQHKERQRQSAPEPEPQRQQDAPPQAEEEAQGQQVRATSCCALLKSKPELPAASWHLYADDSTRLHSGRMRSRAHSSHCPPSVQRCDICFDDGEPASARHALGCLRRLAAQQHNGAQQQNGTDACLHPWPLPRQS